MQRPDTLQEAVLLSERFDQSLYWLKGKSGGRQQSNFRGVSHGQASMYSGSKTAGPSPMVLGKMYARGGMSRGVSRGGVSRGGSGGQSRGGGRSATGTNVECFFCGRKGHMKKDCLKMKNQAGNAGPAQHQKN